MEDLEAAEKEIFVEFSNCSPGRQYHKFVQWKSFDKITGIFPRNILESSEQLFTIQEGGEEPNILKVTYLPQLPNATNHDYFDLTTFIGREKTIHVLGHTIDVNVHSDTKLIVFDCTDPKPQSKNIFLKNTSSTKTYFQFVDDEDCSRLKMTPSKGIIKEHEDIQIHVTYHPRQPGFGFRKIYCLVRWQEPIIFEVRTKYKRVSGNSEFSDFIYTNETLPKYSDGFEEYVADMMRQLPPPQGRSVLTLDRKYIDFGWKNLQLDRTPTVRTFAVTNHALVDCKVTWETGSWSAFTIEPASYFIQSNSRKVFAATFEPTKSDVMMCCEAYAELGWGSHADFVLPVPLSVHFIGHTLFNKRSGWDPFFEIENKRAILPATVPNHSTSRTFLLTNTMKFPLMFKFIPPCESSFVVKPLQGIFKEGFQIVVMRFISESSPDQVKIEDWELELNAHVKVKFQIMATAEYPFLQISEGKKISFPPTNLLCEKSVSVRVLNKTRLHIKYIFSTNLEDSKEFYCEKEDNTIGPLECSQIQMFFKPEKLGRNLSTACWDLSLIRPYLPHITDKSVVDMEGTCCQLQLSAVPNSLSLKGLFKHKILGSFILWNESDCPAHLSLVCTGLEESLFSCKINPPSFTIQANKPKQIEFDIIPNFDGIETIKVSCYFFTNESYKEKINEDSQELIWIRVNARKPELVIKDIRLNNTGVNLTKLHAWKMLRIKKLNKALKSMILGLEMQPILMKLPSSEENSEAIWLELLVENRSWHGAEVALTYERSCTCKCELVNVGLSQRTLQAACIHQSQITFILKKSKYLPKEEGIIEIHCEYTTTDTNQFKYNLCLRSTDDPSLSGSVQLLIERHCNQENTAFVDFFHNSLNNVVQVKLDPVFIGDPCMPIQVLWVYNNSRKESAYEILAETKYKKTIFHFLNKTGRIAAATMHPLFIKFCPIKFTPYIIKADFVTVSRRIRLKVEAEGSAQPCYSTSVMPRSLPLIPHFKEFSSVHSSVDHIIIKPVLLHSISKRLVFLKNSTNDDIKFYWASKQFGALLNISAMPVTGVIGPNETTICQIFVHALCTAARFNAHISCKLINLRERDTYLKKKRKYRADACLFDTSFEFADDGFHIPNVEVPNTPKPSPVYIHLTLSVHSLSERQLDLVMPRLEDQVAALNQQPIIPLHENHDLIMSGEEGAVVMDVLAKITWEVLHKKIFLQSLFKESQDYYYGDILLGAEGPVDTYPPNTVILNVLNGFLCNVIAERLRVEPQWEKSIFMKTFAKDLPRKELLRKLSNQYYSGILERGPYRMMSTYQDRTSVVEHRRSDLARRTTRINFYDDSSEDDDPDPRPRFSYTIL